MNIEQIARRARRCDRRIARYHAYIMTGGKPTTDLMKLMAARQTFQKVQEWQAAIAVNPFRDARKKR